MRTTVVSSRGASGLVYGSPLSWRVCRRERTQGSDPEKVEYRGWKNNIKLTNGEAELIVTLDVGPRVIRYALAGGKNVFKEYDEQMGKSGESEWMIRGGHRLWAAPGGHDAAPMRWTTPRSRIASSVPASIRLTPPADAAYRHPEGDRPHAQARGDRRDASAPDQERGQARRRSWRSGRSR